MNDATCEQALLPGVVETFPEVVAETVVAVAVGAGVVAASSPLHLSLKQQVELHFFVVIPGMGSQASFVELSHRD